MKDTLASKTVQMALVFAGIGIGCVLSRGEIAAAHILSVRNQLKVLGVGAAGVAAKVIPLHLVRRLAYKEVMREHVDAINPVMAVASGWSEIAEPLVTAVCSAWVDSAPETLSDRRDMKLDIAVFQPAVIVHSAHAEMRRWLDTVGDFASARVLGWRAGVYSLWHRNVLSVSTPRAVTAAPGHLSALYFSPFVRVAR